MDNDNEINRRMRWIDRVRHLVRDPRRGADHVGPLLDRAAETREKLKKAGYSPGERQAAGEAAGKEVERIISE